MVFERLHRDSGCGGLEAKEDWMHVLRFRAFVVVVVCAMASSANAQNQSAEELSMTGSRRSTA
jgi:hypothetical protein